MASTDFSIRERIKEQKRSMVTVERMVHLAQWVLTLRDTGASFVECGVAKGGCLAVLKAFAGNNHVWGFDSFEGMPELTPEDEEEGRRWVGINLSGGRNEVEQTFQSLSLGVDDVHIVGGFFEHTLESHKPLIGPIAILRLDNDWYKSTKYCLDTLYSNVIKGGVVLIDDYWTFKGCRKAMDEFRRHRNVEAALHTFDHAEAYWLKD